MNCMKCGKEIQDGQVFCQECLADMEKHPIPQDAHPQILQRPAKSTDKKAREVPMPVQLNRLRKLVRWLLGIIAVLLVAVATLTLLLVHSQKSGDSAAPIGRNYTTVPKTIQ